jgi:hypothetical protein
MGGILTGVIIALSRAIGETAPLITIGALTFIAFLPDSPFKAEFPFISFEWLWSPFTVLPIQMFNWVSPQRFLCRRHRLGPMDDPDDERYRIYFAIDSAMHQGKDAYKTTHWRQVLEPFE